MTDKLKPCPFCGNKPEIRCTSSGTRIGVINQFFRQYKLWCPNCGCNNNKGFSVLFDYSPNTGLHADESELREAIEKWNRRADNATD
jgi:sarcosine oxidase delta subunit